MPTSKKTGLSLTERADRRAEAVRRLKRGEPAADIARDLGFAINSVYALGAKARREGVKSLKVVPRSGRPRKITKTQWPAILRRIAEGPRACGFDRDLWTLPMIREFLLNEYGVEYHVDHLSKLMRDLGMSVQRPAVRAKERDEKAIRRFAKAEFPALEKK
jgi:transposase